MQHSLILTFLELGDATSHNLEFAHLPSVFVSYGEETITESNLLEIRRRHPQQVRVRTFSRQGEANVGADWEWHIIGRRYTLSMRVQAKRVQRDGTLKIRYKSQRDRLLDQAAADNMMPVYCIYCTERQRSIWKQSGSIGDCDEYRTGCLLVDANDVPVTTKDLPEIEAKCVPWHYIFVPSGFAKCSYEAISDRRNELLLRETFHYWIKRDRGDGHSEVGRAWQALSVAALNGQGDRPLDATGIHETNDVDRQRLGSDVEEEDYAYNDDYYRLQERGIRLMLVVDVRDEVIS